MREPRRRATSRCRAATRRYREPRCPIDRDRRRAHRGTWPPRWWGSTRTRAHRSARHFQCCRPVRCGRCAGSSTRRRGRHAPRALDPFISRPSSHTTPAPPSGVRKNEAKPCSVFVPSLCGATSADQCLSLRVGHRDSHVVGVRARAVVLQPVCDQASVASGNTDGTSAQFDEKPVALDDGDRRRPGATVATGVAKRAARVHREIRERDFSSVSLTSLISL